MGLDDPVHGASRGRSLKLKTSEFKILTRSLPCFPFSLIVVALGAM
jgi:uncharacterized membrane protein YdjX (TVP38/TMEM64 family)